MLRETAADEQYLPVLPAWAVAMHPDGRSWACTGQSAKVGFYTDLKDVADLAEVDLEDGSSPAQDDEDLDDKTSDSLGKLVKVIETGRGKFGMELKYVSRLFSFRPCAHQLVTPFVQLEPGRQIVGTGSGNRTRNDHRRGNAECDHDPCLACYVCTCTELVSRFSSKPCAYCLHLRR